MSFTSTIDLTRVLKTRVFDVPSEGTVTVTCDGHMDRPAPCPTPTYFIELEKKGVLVDSSEGTRVYPANGTRHTESWRGLPPGRYRLTISIENSNPNCHLIGNITVGVGTG